MNAKYGLPLQVAYCNRCVISNQRPSSAREYAHTAESKKETIHFDGEGVCSACRVAEDKQRTNWQSRETELLELCARNRSPTGAFDCIVPGSGGKDSFYAAHILKTKYRMHPLTVTWAPHLYTDWGRRNHQRWIDAGFTNLLYTPDSRVHRLLTRLAVENLFHPFQPFIIGQKALAPKLAAQFGIPLVFYGENEAEYGNSRASTLTPQRSATFHENSSTLYLGGVSTGELKAKHGLNESDLEPYIPADPEVLSAKQVEVHYLGYYLRWHPQACYYYSVRHGGFEPSPERTSGTYSKYNSIDDKIDDFHYWTTFQKFGLGRASYDAAQEIRSGELTREEGVALVKRFDGEFPTRFLEEINAYLSVDGMEPMTLERWWNLALKFRSPHLFDEDGPRYIVT